jgi:hypothetical protein
MKKRVKTIHTCAYQTCRHFGTCRMDGGSIQAPRLFPYKLLDQDLLFSSSLCSIDELSHAEPLLECDLRLNIVMNRVRHSSKLRRKQD